MAENPGRQVAIAAALLPELWRLVAEFVAPAERMMIAHEVRIFKASNIDQFELHALIRDGYLNVLQWLADRPGAPVAAAMMATTRAQPCEIVQDYKSLHFVVWHHWAADNARPRVFAAVLEVDITAAVEDRDRTEWGESTVFWVSTMKAPPIMSIQGGLLVCAAFCGQSAIFEWLLGALPRPAYTEEEVSAIAEHSTPEMLKALKSSWMAKYRIPDRVVNYPGNDLRLGPAMVYYGTASFDWRQEQLRANQCVGRVARIGPVQAPGAVRVFPHPSYAGAGPRIEPLD